MVEKVLLLSCSYLLQFLFAFGIQKKCYRSKQVLGRLIVFETFFLGALNLTIALNIRTYQNNTVWLAIFAKNSFDVVHFFW